MDKLTKIRELCEKAKLRSDDHGHCTESLKIYCLNLAAQCCDEIIPALLDVIEIQREALERCDLYKYDIESICSIVYDSLNESDKIIEGLEIG